MSLLSRLVAGGTCYCLAAWPAPPNAIGLHASNPHYFDYKGKPSILLTSGEHYSAVLNAKFDFEAYLQELQRHGLNLTRTFSGTYREAAVDPHGSTPLSPGRGPGNYVAPWAFSDAVGGYDGQKYDLNQWNPAYFDRLRRFVKAAEARGVIVELVLFCRMYSDRNHWRISPLHPDNNIQGESWRGVVNGRFMTTGNQDLLARQQAVTRKIVTELRDAPNVYFEIGNEPASGPHDSEFARDVHAWHEAIAREIADAEAVLPATRHHLIAYNDHYDTGRGIGPIPAPGLIGILNGHYLWKLADTLAEYGKGRALALDETRWIAHPKLGIYGNTMTPESGRLEAWEFLFGGGAVYSGLNYAYQVGNETGTAPESDTFKGYLSKLKSYFESLPFVRMRPDATVVAGGVPAASHVRALSEPGRTYAIYIHHGVPSKGHNLYEIPAGTRTLRLSLLLPRGNYQADWIRPADARVLSSHRLRVVQDGPHELPPSPAHNADIAIRMTSLRNK